MCNMGKQNVFIQIPIKILIIFKNFFLYYFFIKIEGIRHMLTKQTSQEEEFWYTRMLTDKGRGGSGKCQHCLIKGEGGFRTPHFLLTYLVNSPLHIPYFTKLK